MTNKHHALLTGGSTGIGAAICKRLLDAGYAVVSLDRKPASVTPASSASATARHRSSPAT